MTLREDFIWWYKEKKMKKKIILWLFWLVAFLVPGFSSAIMTTVDNPFAYPWGASLPQTYNRISVQYGYANMVNRWWRTQGYWNYNFVSPIIFWSPVGWTATIVSANWSNPTYSVIHNNDTQDRAHCQLFFDFDLDNGWQKCILSSLWSPVIIDWVELYNYWLTSVGWFFYNVKNGPLFEIKDLYHLVGNNIYKNIFVDVDTSYTLTIKDLNINKEFKRYNILNKDPVYDKFKQFKFFSSMGWWWFEDFVATFPADSTFDLLKDPLGNQLFFTHIPADFYWGLIESPVNVNYTRGWEVASWIWTPSEWWNDWDIGWFGPVADWSSFNACVGYWDDVKEQASYSRNCYLDLLDNDFPISDFNLIEDWDWSFETKPTLSWHSEICNKFKDLKALNYVFYEEEEANNAVEALIGYWDFELFLDRITTNWFNYYAIDVASKCEPYKPTVIAPPTDNEQKKNWINKFVDRMRWDVWEEEFWEKVYDENWDLIWYTKWEMSEEDFSKSPFAFLDTIKTKRDEAMNYIPVAECNHNNPFNWKLDIIMVVVFISVFFSLFKFFMK